MKFWVLLITLNVNLISFSQTILVEGAWITPVTFGFENVSANRLFPAPINGQIIKIKTSLINKKLYRLNIPALDIQDEYVRFKGFNPNSIKQNFINECLLLLPKKENENWVLQDIQAHSFLGEIQTVTVVINVGFAQCEVLIVNDLKQSFNVTLLFELNNLVLILKAKVEIQSGKNVLPNVYESYESLPYTQTIKLTQRSRANGLIHKDQIITARNIKKEMSVWKSDMIQLVSIVGDVTLSIQVTALQDGEIGDQVYVQFKDKKIKATIVAQNKVEIRGGL
ncbi:MAG: flagella basal body P-ring formation protein FlgA [Saccharospirillaceae bacterium]|nr:flagella basal body P-ring formation protein FlgA [Pseudomonadales bacterium]NRB79727.1 flagella basal body P-ring formation protein FlgA [Saccharospirillaceae bacterium]